MSSFSHYFCPDHSLEHEEQLIEFDILGRTWRLLTDRGVFSRNRLDAGTRLLLEVVAPMLRDGYRVLDLGCGYGPVSVIIKSLYPDIKLTACDISERAIDITNKNLQQKKLTAQVLLSDGVPAAEQDANYGGYDLILTNPPIRAGKAVVYKFFDESYLTLKSGGSLFVVIRKQQGAASAEKKLHSLFGNCQRLCSQAGYRILRAQK